MKNTNDPQPVSRADGARFTDVREFRVDDGAKELFQRELSGFVPPNAFDAHTHLYDFAHLTDEFSPASQVGYEVYLEQQCDWMGSLAPSDALFFRFLRAYSTYMQPTNF